MPGFSEASLEPAVDGLPLHSGLHPGLTFPVAVHECPKPTATDVVNCILDRPIEWVDWKSLPHEARLHWSNDAQAVLNNPAFISLCGKMKDDARKTNGELVKTLIESGFRYSENLQAMKDVRMTINGIELIRENLEAMLYAEQPTTTEDIQAGI